MNEARLIDIVNRGFRLIRFWRERNETKEIEIERLKGVVGRLQKVAEKQQREISQLEAPETFDAYNAQNELELLRTIRRSQAEGITKLRQQLAEACAERDAASHRANAWRMDYNQMKQDRDVVKDERDVAREGLTQARSAVQAMTKELDAARQCLSEWQERRHCEMARRHGQEYLNPRLEMILEESYRNEFKRNIDNQKATDAPNCQSS